MVNGQHFSGTGYQLDGTENRDPILGIIVINPNLEAIGEAKITSQNYDAEFGQATAGVVSIQTRSGTNEIHGSAFEFYQTDQFQARNPYSQPDRLDPITGRVLPETSRHNFGAAIGGPIVQNKWFFFGDYQGLRSTVGGSRRLTVPTAAARARRPAGVRRQHLRPADRPAVPGQRDPASRLSPAGAEHPGPDPAAQRRGHPRQLHRAGVGDLRQRRAATCGSTGGSATA